MRLINDFELNIVEQQFETECKLLADVGVGRIHQLNEKLQLLFDTGNAIKFQTLSGDK